VRRNKMFSFSGIGFQIAKRPTYKPLKVRVCVQWFCYPLHEDMLPVV